MRSPLPGCLVLTVVMLSEGSILSPVVLSQPRIPPVPPPLLQIPQPRIPSPSPTLQIPQPRKPPAQSEADRLLAKSRQARNPKEVVRLLQQAAQLYQRDNNRREQAYTLVELSAAYYRNDQSNQAVEAAKQALTVMKTLKSPREERWVLEFQQLLYKELGQLSQSIPLQEQVVAIARQSSPQEEATALYNLGNLYRSLQQYPVAIETYQSALRIAETFPLNEWSQGDNLAIDILRNLIDVQTQAGQAAQTSILRERFLQEIQGKALIEQVFLSSRDSAYPTDVLLLEEALKVYRRLNQSQKEAQVLLLLALKYAEQGQLTHALQGVQSARILAQKQGNRNLEIRALSSLGRMYSVLQQYPQAIEAYQQQMTLSSANSLPYREALIQLSTLYQITGQFQQSQAIRQRMASLPLPNLPTPVPRSIPRLFPSLFRIPIYRYPTPGVPQPTRIPVKVIPSSPPVIQPPPPSVPRIVPMPESMPRRE